MKIVAQMDEISSIKVETDTTFLLLLAAQDNGCEIYYYHPSKLIYDNKKQTALANIKKIKLFPNQSNYYQVIEEKIEDLKSFDVILIRQNPPFDMHYLTATYILEKIQDQVLVINNPSEIRNCPEKIWVTEFSDLTPPTIISSDVGSILEFLNYHEKIIIKPLYGFGGESVLLLKKDDNNINTNIDMMLKSYNNLPFIAQKFLPEILKNDKRIFLVNGEPISAISRVAKAGEIRANTAVGGSAFECELSKRDYEICNRLKPHLQNKGLFLAGIDIIGDYLIEVNITSPMGIVAMNRIYQQKFHHQIFIKILDQLNEFNNKKVKNINI